MSTISRLVPPLLGAAMFVLGPVGVSAEPQERVPPEAAQRESAPPPPPMSSPSSSGGFAVERSAPPSAPMYEPRDRGEQRVYRGDDGGRSSRYGDGGQARERVPPSVGSRGGGGGSSSQPSGPPPGSGGGGYAVSRPRGGNDGYVGGRSGDNRSDGYSSGDDRRRYPYYTPRGGQSDRDGGYAVPRGRYDYPGSYYPRYDYYRPYRPSYYYPYYGNWGMGLYFWDPTWYSWGIDNGYYYGSGGYYPDAGYGSRYVPMGSVRIRVAPRDAEVWVDGYYVGVVDEFDGVFQRLRLEEGPHRIDIRLPGFDVLRFDVRVLGDSTLTLRGDLRPLR